MVGLAFGMFLPVQAQPISLAQPWEADAGPDEMLAVARACDEAGFHYIAVCDHVVVPRDLAWRMTTTWYDTISTLGWLAGVTRRVHLLSAVYVVPYRHPLQTAKSFATLDVLSKGRVILGVGAGHVEAEFDLLGVSFEERGRTTDESLKMVRRAFRDEWAAGDFGQRPRPVTPDGPRIWVGGSSRRALRRAAELGDGWLPQGPPEGGMGAAIEYLRERRDAVGRADEEFAVGGDLSVYVGSPDWEVGPGYVTGSADRLADELRQLEALGVTHVELRFATRGLSELLDQIDAFCRDIAPSVH